MTRALPAKVRQSQRRQKAGKIAAGSSLPHQDAAQTPSGGGAPQGPPPQDGESGAGASGATGSRGSRGEKGGAEAGGVSAGRSGGVGIGRGSSGGIGSRGGAPAPQDLAEANKKRKFVSGEGAFAQHATSASVPSSSQEVHMSDGAPVGWLP